MSTRSVTPQTFAPGVFRAGDLALRSDSGGYRILGRASDYFVKDDGTPVNLFEVDERLRKRYSTTEILSVQVQDPATGRSRVRTYVGADGPADAAIRDALHAEGFTAEVAVARVGKIPRTPVGKYDKGALLTQRGFETPHGPVRYERGTADEQRRSIVMIPGLGFGARIFEPLAESLSDLARIHVLDLPGHGEYTHASDYTLASYVAIVREFLRTLESDDVTLLGWSLGATIVWQTLHAENEGREKSLVSRAVIVEQSPRLVRDEDWPHGAFGRLTAHTAADTHRGIETDPSGFIDSLITQSVYPRERSDLRGPASEAGVVDSDALSVLWEEATHVDQRTAVANLRVPTLLIFGEASQVYPTDVGAWLEKHLPDATSIKFEGAGHMPFLDDPQRFTDAIRRFVTHSNPTEGN